MGSDRVEQLGPDAGHSIEAFQAPEWAPLTPIGHDPRRESRTDAWQSGQFRCIGPIQVDALTGRQGTSQRRRSLRHRGPRRRVCRPAHRELHVSRSTRAWGQNESGSNAESGKGGQEQRGTSIFAGHDPSMARGSTIRPRVGVRATRKPRGLPQ